MITIIKFVTSPAYTVEVGSFMNMEMYTNDE